MADVEIEGAVTEVNEGVVEEVHCIKDLDAASDFELKHTPMIEVIEGANGQTVKVTVGLNGLVHPQTEEHLIEWIRVFVGEEIVASADFGPGQTPEVTVDIERDSLPVVAQSLCNQHGIWEARA